MGQRRPRPNLFIVGAMKCGTSSLHAYLGQHPSIFMSEPKEPCYFVDREQLNWPAIESLGFWRSEERYLELFESVTRETVIGESSTLYSKLPRITGVAERIARFEPGARILYIMRDPIERTISHYWHSVRWEGETRDPLAAIRREPDYREVSFYAMQLKPYLELFGRRQVTSLTLEELRSAPGPTLNRLFRWLELEPVEPSQETTAARNVTPPEVERVRGRGFLHRFRFSRFWEVAGPFVPARLRQMGRGLSATTVERNSEPVGEVVEYLRPIQRRETEMLEELLERSFSEWTTLWGLGE